MRTTLLIMTILAAPAFAVAQEMPKPAEQHEMLKKSVGTWTGVMTMEMPGVPEPVSMPVKETDVMLDGDLWVLSDFESGPFKGRSQIGYDTRKKKFVGTWIDNSSTALNVMSGKYDKATGEMTMTFKGIDPATGEPQDMKSVTKYVNENERHFVMYGKTGDKWTQMFEITSKRAE